MTHDTPNNVHALNHDETKRNTVVNNDRIIEIDFGRGLAVLALAIIHTLWMYANIETQEHSILGHVVHFIGKGTAAFLICMGISMAFSRKQTFSSIFIRGLYILGLSYLLNFLKFIIPISVFNTMPEEFIAAYGWQSPLNFAQLKYLLLTGDILQMAGVALILLAVIKHFIKNKWGILGIGIFIAVISRESAGLRIGGDTFKYLNELFFSGGYHVYFPVVPWMSFILIGMFIGDIMKENSGKRQTMFTNILYAGIVSLIVGGTLCYLNFDYNFGNFFNLGPGGVVYLLGINLVLLWIIHLWVRSSSTDNIVTRALHYLSKRVTSIYIIQWVVICWGMGIIGFRTLDSTQTAGMMVVILAITLVIQRVIDLLKASFRQKSIDNNNPTPASTSV
ncbi:hypothetical protein TDB9533_04575 [Thalassocella blandensis]|nr:hypothetical protein TDB9533_04575 [Thalassocella blandensis]